MHLSLAALLIAFAEVNVIGSRLLNDLTKAGADLLSRIEGFRLHLLSMPNQPDRQAQFERYAGYAFALDIEV
jgi:hypothetical protein